MRLANPIAVDTNVLLRSKETSHAQHLVADGAVSKLSAQGVSLYVFPQKIREFWNVTTRPIANNGLGFSIAKAEVSVGQLESTFSVLPDGLTPYQIWRKMVVQHQVSGVQVHDCYLAAAMAAHGITHLLTFNAGDFKRYGITAVAPASV